MVKIWLPKQSGRGAVEYADEADQCKDLFLSCSPRCRNVAP